MNIRLAKIGDRDAILSLLNELINEVNKKSRKPPGFTDKQNKRRKIYQELIKRDDVKIFVAEENSCLIGVADLFIMPIMRRGYCRGHLEDLVVTKEMRGKGIGTALINSIKEYCKNNDIKVIKLTSGLELNGAHKFYKKNGGVSTEKMFRFDIV